MKFLNSVLLRQPRVICLLFVFSFVYEYTLSRVDAQAVATWQVKPGKLEFNSRKDIQTLQLLSMSADGAAVEDASDRVQWVVEPARLARIEPGPILVPLASGEGNVVGILKSGERVSAQLRINLPELDREKQWSFENHVQPVLTRAGCNQGACHGAASGKNGFRLTLRGYGPELDYQAITRQAGGRRIVPGQPEQSLLLWKATGVVPHAGAVRIALETREYEIVADWIERGAPGLSETTPGVVRLELEPRKARFRVGDSGRITVKAIYADNSSEDVTAWAKFSSTDTTVAVVDEDGRFVTENPGEAHISVWYGNRVSTAMVSVPDPKPISTDVFAKAARNNPIDDFNLAKLKALGIPPSGDAGDAAWLRRVSLDVTGLLPTVEELIGFEADQTPDKRRRMIEKLLASPEATDYWAYQWSDLLLVSSNKLQAPAMWAFYQFVRESVAENKPWDKFVREVITAKGSTLKNGAGNFFVLHRDPTDLMESASVSFLGLSMTCARCHNHPMEKWTQDQYYGFAGMFSRVALKDGLLAGDVVVSDRSDGEIVHPRRGGPVVAQPLEAKPFDESGQKNRREVLADWVTDAKNPMFSKAIINRVWKKFFGQGLMPSEDDLRETAPPMDAELLAWLEADFIKHGFDLRHLMSTILQSAVYARSSKTLPQNRADARYLSHSIARRLPAEVLLDVYSQVTEVASGFSGFPEKWRAIQLPDTNVANGFLKAFGRPSRQTVCSCERSNEPSVAQALHLSNGDSLNNKLKSDKGYVQRLSDSEETPRAMIRQVFMKALSREPSAKELENLEKQFPDEPGADSDKSAWKAARRAAIEDLVWAILTSDEFLFNH